MAKRNVLLREFIVQVFADGTIDFDGFDDLLWWRIHHKPQEGFDVYANQISKYGDHYYRRRKPKRKEPNKNKRTR